MRRVALLLAAVSSSAGGCGDEVYFVQPIYDLPADDPAATASGLDSLTLSIAREGDETDLVAQTFAPGELVELPNVPFADDLVIHLTGLVGGSDVAYGRSCTFDLARDLPAPAPHLFFARNVKFASLAFTPLVRAGGTAITDEAGNGLVLGGVDGAGVPVGRVERFDPRTAEYTELATFAARTDAAVTTLGIGSSTQIAMIGGAADGTGAGFVELLARDGRYERVDDLELARMELTATALTDGRVVVIGGRTPGGPVSGAIAELRSTGGAVEVRPLAAQLAAPRAGHTATRLGDDVGAPVLVAGGLGPAGAVAVAELFKPLSGDLANPLTFAPSMIVPRHRHLARLMPDGSVLFIGGLDGTGAPVRTLERFTIDAGFVAVGELPAGAGLVDATATTLPDGRILLAGGRLAPGGPALTDAFIARLDVVDGSVDVVATDRLAEPRAGHQATLLCDGTVLVVGGTTAPSVAERYNPPPFGRR